MLGVRKWREALGKSLGSTSLQEKQLNFFIFEDEFEFILEYLSSAYCLQSMDLNSSAFWRTWHISPFSFVGYILEGT